MRAQEARKKAAEATDDRLREELLQTADTWERMATYEHKHNPPRSR